MDWIIIATRESNKTVFAAVVPGENEQDARHSFREIYRHDCYTILSVEEVPDGYKISEKLK